MQAKKFLLITFLFCPVPGSYHMITDFLSDMPSVYIGMIFALDWSCDETLFNAFLIIEHILMV